MANRSLDGLCGQRNAAPAEPFDPSAADLASWPFWAPLLAGSCSSRSSRPNASPDPCESDLPGEPWVGSAFWALVWRLVIQAPSLMNSGGRPESWALSARSRAHDGITASASVTG
jgi:hypothetical protein